MCIYFFEVLLNKILDMDLYIMSGFGKVNIKYK